MSSYTPIKLAYEVTEPEKRTNLNDIILIHGLSHSKIGWKKLNKKFAYHTGRRVYALDMRNHGDSEWSEDCSIDILVKDILHFMDEKDIKYAALIGHSLGAKVAIDFALAQPERVEKIVLEDFGPGALPESSIQMIAEWLTLSMKATETIPPDASYQEAVKIVFDFIYDNLPEDVLKKAEFVKPDPSVLELPLTKSEGRYVLKSNVDFLVKSIQTGSCKASEGLCTKPALFIYGTLSPLKVKEDEELIMKLFPNAKLHAMEVASHNLHGDHPDEFCKVVFKFLSES